MNKCCENQQIHRVLYQRNLIMEELSKRNFRITKQRKVILDIIMDHECTCCKEIYSRANLVDSTIGIATVYRMINVLEEIGAIDRKNLYRINYQDSNQLQEGYTITYSDKETIQLSQNELCGILEKHFAKIRQKKKGNIASIVLKKQDKIIELI